MQAKVEETREFKSERFKDGLYQTGIFRVRELTSPENEKFLVLDCVVQVPNTFGVNASFTLPSRLTNSNRHGRFLKALKGIDALEVGADYDTSKYEGGVISAYWEWDDRKKRMKTDKFNRTE